MKLGLKTQRFCLFLLTFVLLGAGGTPENQEMTSNPVAASQIETQLLESINSILKQETRTIQEEQILQEMLRSYLTAENRKERIQIRRIEAKQNELRNTLFKEQQREYDFIQNQISQLERSLIEIQGKYNRSKDELLKQKEHYLKKKRACSLSLGGCSPLEKTSALDDPDILEGILEQYRNQMRENEELLQQARQKASDTEVSHRKRLESIHHEEEQAIAAHKYKISQNMQNYLPLIDSSRIRELLLTHNRILEDPGEQKTSGQREGSLTSRTFRSPSLRTQTHSWETDPPARHFRRNSTSSLNERIERLENSFLELREIAKANTDDLIKIVQLIHLDRLNEILNLSQEHPKAFLYYNEVYKVFYITLLTYLSVHTGKVPESRGRTQTAGEALEAFIGTFSSTRLIAYGIKSFLFQLKDKKQKVRVQNVYETFTPKSLEAVSQIVSLHLATEFREQLNSLDKATILETAKIDAKTMYHQVTYGKIKQDPSSVASNFSPQEVAQFLIRSVLDTYKEGGFPHPKQNKIRKDVIEYSERAVSIGAGLMGAGAASY